MPYKNFYGMSESDFSCDIMGIEQYALQNRSQLTRVFREDEIDWHHIGYLGKHAPIGELFEVEVAENYYSPSYFTIFSATSSTNDERLCIFRQSNHIGIKDPDGHNVAPNLISKHFSEDLDCYVVYCIKLYIVDEYLYVPISIEFDRNIEYGYTLHSQTSAVPSTFKPYQPFAYTTAPAIDVTRKTAVINSSQVISSSTSRNTELFNDITSSQNANTTVTMYKTVYTGDSSSRLSQTISISDWDTKTYSIVTTGSSYALYSGKEVGEDFLTAFKVRYRRYASWTGGSKTLDTYPQNRLEKSKMSVTVPEDDDAYFSYNYNISSFTETSTTSIGVSNVSFKHLASGTTKFDMLVCPVKYNVGDVITTKNLSDLGQLKYADGTSVALTNLKVTSYELVCSLGTLPQTVTAQHPTFTITYNFTITGIGSLTKTFNCSLADESITSIVLSGEKHIFTPDETIQLGNTATAKLYNDSTLLETLTDAQIMANLSSTPKIDEEEVYGQLASNFLQDGEVSLVSTLFGKSITQKIGFTYYSQELQINVSNVKTSYIMPSTFSDFDYTGLVVKITKHTSTYQNGVVTTVQTEETVASGDYTCTHETIDVTATKTYIVTVSFEDDYGIIHTATFPVVATPLVAIRIDCSGSQNYYNNGTDKFRTPSGITFTKVYNDPTYNETLPNLNNIVFYRNASSDVPLVVGTSVIATSGGDTIRFVETTSNVEGLLSINWVLDTVQSVSISNSTAISIPLGDRLRTAKSKFNLLLTYASGNTTTLSGQNNPNSFDFVNTEIVTSALTVIRVAINGVGEFNLSNVAQKVTFTDPYAELKINTDNFQKDYINQVDRVTMGGLSVKVLYYEDITKDHKCEYEETLEYSNTATQQYNKYTATGFSGYTIGDIINISMGGADEVSKQLTVNAYKRLNTGTEEQLSGTVNIRVVSILDIVGIRIDNADTEYHVGETFLNDTDNTQVTLFFKNANNETKSMTVLLRNGLTSLNVYPVKGTRFNSIYSTKVTISSALNGNIKAEYNLDIKSKYTYSSETKHNLVALYLSNYVCPDNVSRSKYFLVEKTIKVGNEVIEITSINSTTGEREIRSGYAVSDLIVYGYLEDINDPTTNAKVVLFKDYVSPIEGSNNVTVKFPCYVAGNADYINKAHFGIMFGNNNAKNRLFVSGNSEYANFDWHSSEVDVNYTEDETMVNGNYGYFEDTSYCKYGETDNAVIGYDIVSNDKLLVLKSKSDKETTVYFRQPQLVTAINNSGTAVTGLDSETLYQEEFTLTMGNNSVAGINPKAVVNLNGDCLFVSSDNQVVGLDLTGIIGDNQRYANSRSYYIDEDLRNQDLSKSILWTNNKYLFVTLPNKVYVSHYEIKSDSQYEWFVLDIPDIQSVIDVDGKIYFGNSSGELYRFSEDYLDAKKIFVGYGVARLSVNEKTELIIAQDDLSKVQTGDLFKPVVCDTNVLEYNRYLYYKLGDISNSGNRDFKLNGTNDITCNSDISKYIKEDVAVYLNHTDEDEEIVCSETSSLRNAYGIKFYLREKEPIFGSHRYNLYDENGNVVDVKYLYRASLCLRLEKPMTIKNVNVQSGTFNLYDEETKRIVNIVQYGLQQLVTAFKGEIIHYNNVEAYYITKPFEMGSIEYFKTVWSFTLCNDSNIASELELCYSNNKIPYADMKTIAEISKSMLGFNLSDYDFTRVDFDKNVVPRTYTNKRIVSGVKFLCFAFRNYNATNSVLSSLTITYTLPYPSYGGD